MKNLIFLFIIALLLFACSPRISTKTSKTIKHQIDSVITIPKQNTTFISQLPKQGDSVVLTDRNTGIQLTITEFISLDTILSFWADNAFLKTQVKTLPKKEYEFKIKLPEKKIPVKINETIFEINKTNTTPNVPWYYKISFKVLVFVLVVILMMYLLKRFLS